MAHKLTEEQRRKIMYLAKDWAETGISARQLFAYIEQLLSDCERKAVERLFSIRELGAIMGALESWRRTVKPIMTSNPTEEETETYNEVTDLFVKVKELRQLSQEDKLNGKENG